MFTIFFIVRFVADVMIFTPFIRGVFWVKVFQFDFVWGSDLIKCVAVNVISGHSLSLENKESSWFEPGFCNFIPPPSHVFTGFS